MSDRLQKTIFGNSGEKLAQEWANGDKIAAGPSPEPPPTTPPPPAPSLAPPDRFPLEAVRRTDRPPSLDWGDIHRGASMFHATPEQTQILLEDIPDDELDILATGEVYATQIKYRELLVRAFGVGGWALVPLSDHYQEGKKLAQEWALYIGGHFISRALGGSEYHENNERMSKDDALEAVKSNALTRCCKDLAIASKCWDKRRMQKWQKEYAVEVWCKPHPRARDMGSSGKRLWRRKDAPKFEYPWMEDGVVVDGGPPPGPSQAPPAQRPPAAPRSAGPAPTGPTGRPEIAMPGETAQTAPHLAPKAATAPNAAPAAASPARVSEEPPAAPAAEELPIMLLTGSEFRKEGMRADKSKWRMYGLEAMSEGGEILTYKFFDDPSAGLTKARIDALIHSKARVKIASEKDSYGDVKVLGIEEVA